MLPTSIKFDMNKTPVKKPKVISKECSGNLSKLYRGAVEVEVEEDDLIEERRVGGLLDSRLFARCDVILFLVSF